MNARQNKRKIKAFQRMTAIAANKAEALPKMCIVNAQFAYVHR